MNSSQERLTKRFPYQFRDINTTKFAFSLPPGWTSLFEQLCTDVDAALDSESRQRFQWRQVKEKFGALRAYFDFGAAPSRALGNEAVQGNPAGTTRAPDADARKKINLLVETASNRSKNICVFCREPGTIREERPWISPVCDAHIHSRFESTAKEN